MDFDEDGIVIIVHDEAHKSCALHGNKCTHVQQSFFIHNCGKCSRKKGMVKSNLNI